MVNIFTNSKFEANQQMLADETEMNANIEDLKARCTWLSESLIEQRSSLENNLTALAEHVQKGNSCNAQESKLNQYVELINQQQQVIEFLLHKSEMSEKDNSINFREIFPNISPYSGNRSDAPQFVKIVRKLFQTSNYNDEQKNFFLSTHMGSEYNWYDFNKVDNEGNSRKPEDVLNLFKETFVIKLSLQEYINRWMNLNLTWGKEYDNLAKFNQVLKEISYEIQKLDEFSTVQDLYDCILKLKREKDEMKRLYKSRGVDSRKWPSSSSKSAKETSKKKSQKTNSDCIFRAKYDISIYK
ncbi:hypothetical protein PIROE2DRAFT_2262 [Piromyces sp. E2]|nr:hypothetical protein PIROE2DRAFT_2262 [Piromyces sp. E2]|eukprot:OUM69830.1 hypothetical protein PIROE2DRAFT_2262 [Piromyces sp. E2]